MSFRVESVNKFVNAMLESEAKFAEGLKSYEEKQSEINEIFNTLQKETAALSEKYVCKDDNKNISELKRNVIGILHECINNGSKKILESGKGLNFIRKHEKTFVVSVFGKVKSGKSSLGNFIMGTELKKLKISTDYDKINPVVTVEDRGKITTNSRLETISEDDEGFEVGSTETTSTIQYFQIGGMTWFDTPGIGSITKENEELAKEYIQNSDLVIFTCNSDAAGTQQEFSEMKRLSEMKKPVLLLVTMSDTYDEDVDDSGNIVKELIAKNETDRKDVEDYLINSIKEQGLNDILEYSSVMTISKQLAVVAFQQEDDEKYHQSNIDLFLEKLIEITQNNAAQMKLATPMKRINTMIDDIIGNNSSENTLSALKKSVMENISQIDSQVKELEVKKETILLRIKNESMLRIQDMISRYRGEISQNGGSINSENISNEIVKIISETSKKICEEELSEFINSSSTKLFDSVKKGGFSIPDMKMKTESISYKQQYVERRRRDPKGLFEKIGSKLFHREYHENVTRTETKTNTFNVGINEAEVISAIYSQINIYFTDNVVVQINDLINMYYKPVREVQENSILLIDGTIAKLNKIKSEL